MYEKQQETTGAARAASRGQQQPAAASRKLHQALRSKQQATSSRHQAANSKLQATKANASSTSKSLFSSTGIDADGSDLEEWNSILASLDEFQQKFREQCRHHG